MKYLSLCSGIEAASLAFAPLGWSPVLFSEIEAFPRAVLEQRWGARDLRRAGSGGVPLWGDMTALKPRHFARFGIETPDLVVAGTPCQAFSVAGLRKGLADDRGNLTLQFVRIVDAVDNLRRHRGEPQLLGVWENVPGVLSSRDNAFGCFLAALAGCDTALVPPGRAGWSDSGVVVGPKRALAWRCLDAQHFGLAQRRKRVFVVFGPRDWPVAAALFPQSDSVRGDPQTGREAGQDLAAPIASSPRGGSGYRNDADTTENLVAVDLQNCALGGEVAGTLDTTRPTRGGGQAVMAFGGNNTAGAIDVATARNAHGGPHGRLDFETETFITHALDSYSAGRCTEDGTGRGVPLVPTAMMVRRLTPTECERLQGFGDGYTAIMFRGKEAADGPRYRALGNSMAVPCMRWIGRQIARVAAV